MKRLISFIYFLPCSLALMAGDRLPGSSKSWTPTFSITVLIIGILLIIWGIINNNSDEYSDDCKENFFSYGALGVLAGIMGLVATCISSVTS